MRSYFILSLLAAIPFSLAAPSVAAPALGTSNWDESWILAGPANYTSIQEQVAAMQADGSHPNANARDLSKRVCEGVYFCDGNDWQGSCYYACYPISVAIYPDPSWVGRISSAGPDQGGWCDFYAGNACDPGQFSHVIFYYPGGNLPSPVNNNLGCFYCNPK